MNNSKSNIFKLAHSKARSIVAIVGDYMIAFKLSLKEIYSKIKANNPMLKKQAKPTSYILSEFLTLKAHTLTVRQIKELERLENFWSQCWIYCTLINENVIKIDREWKIESGEDDILEPAFIARKSSDLIGININEDEKIMNFEVKQVSNILKRFKLNSNEKTSKSYCNAVSKMDSCYPEDIPKGFNRDAIEVIFEDMHSWDSE